MDTNRLKQFCVIVETGSLSKASQLLHITHSGLSKSMKLLQDELKCRLMQPAGRGLTLTHEGIEVYHRAKHLLLEEEKLLAAVKPAMRDITYKIGTVEIFLQPLIQGLKNPFFNDIKLTLLDLEPGQIELLLSQQQCDVGITYVPYPMPDIDIIEMGSFRLGCYYTNPAFETFPFSELPFVAPAHGLLSNPLNIKERDGWVESLYPRKIKYEVNLLSSAIELTMSGCSAIHIPDFVAHHINASGRYSQQLVEHSFSKDKSNQQKIYMLKRTNQESDATFSELENIVRTFTDRL